MGRNAGGPDDSFSLEPTVLAALCRDARAAWEALGKVDYDCQPSEKGNLQFRRSLYFVRDLNAGEIVTSDAIRSIRPGFGLPPKYLDQCLGLKVNQAVKRGTPVAWEMMG